MNCFNILKTASFCFNEIPISPDAIKIIVAMINFFSLVLLILGFFSVSRMLVRNAMNNPKEKKSYVALIILGGAMGSIVTLVLFQNWSSI